MAPLAILPNLRANTPPAGSGASPAAVRPGFVGELARQMKTGAPGDGAPIRIEAAPTHTPMSGSEAASALARAWRSVTGQTPGPKLLSVLVAQWAHETGRGESMLNYNFGGLKGSAPSGMSAAYRTHEGSGETARVTTDRFRAYATADEGAVDYVRFLKAHYPAALDAAQAGDARGFVHELKRSGYFTDNEESYAHSVSDLATRAERNGFDAVGAAAKDPRRPALALGGANVAFGSATGLPFANHIIDPTALADEIAQAALRIANSKPEDHLNEIERLDTRPAT